MVCQHNRLAHDDNLCVKFSSLKMGIGEVLITIDGVLKAKISLRECSQYTQAVAIEILTNPLREESPTPGLQIGTVL